MNTNAKKHLDAAKTYIARGEEYYLKAAEEIVAAKKADHTLSNREIGKWFGRSDPWVRQIVSWATSSQGTALPFSESKGEVAKRHTRAVLRNTEPEEIAELLDDPEVRQKVAAAQRVQELRQENRTGIPRRNAAQGPSFISLVLRISGWLDELSGMVERGEAEIPAEFSTQSLSDIGVKAMRLKEQVDDVRETGEVLSRD
jgi:hypothetical protein